VIAVLPLFLLAHATAAGARLPARALQEEDRTRDVPASEGPLDNDVFVPVADAAEKALAAADVLGVRLFARESADASALGAAAVGLAGVGLIDSPMSLSRPGEHPVVFLPDDGRHAGYVRWHDTFRRRVAAALTPHAEKRR
jgi:hypothetical protein